MPSLQDLPFELISRIAESFCLRCGREPSRQCPLGCLAVSCHCCCPDRHDQNNTVDVNTATRALGALCLTSRPLNDAATPHISTTVHERSDGGPWPAPFSPSRPSLDTSSSSTFPSPFSVPKVKPTSCPRSCPTTKSHVDNYVASLPDDERNHFLRFDHQDDSLISGNTNDHVTILTSLCPSLETFEAMIGRDAALYFSPPRLVAVSPHPRTSVLRY
ncbi:hypothetical protein B0H67DRAFT_582447 [Lasiosphaeris hirsuta]|uniref:Uncharacterized protein n=1 Tax=Lasiosphaeris hirsuta TaxID=260670 RepID=A0AA40AHV0_9PEZI|nr:hypothetical protein B0H67DRAFT_582447 [Lasiosphaeris hirsuta]